MSEKASWTIRSYNDFSDIPSNQWNNLLWQSPMPTPFMRYEWLNALHNSACASLDTGWTLFVLTAHNSQEPIEISAACVIYIKTHSFGEYVFDWAWAQAYQRAGLNYYPKLLCASPFTPVQGSRLLGKNPEAKLALLHGIQSLAISLNASSTHLLFGDAQDLVAAQSAGWMIRQGVQFHWHNRHIQTPEAPAYADMADFLAALHRDKRKKIQQERRRVREANVSVRAVCGPEISESDWAFFNDCYCNTYLAHGNAPYLNDEFFKQIARSMSSSWLMFIAERQGLPIACSLLGIDHELKVAWGRYWGAKEQVPCLHFELCYYAPIEWCIEQKFERFEGGAQGEHKMARGLMPTSMWSAHRLNDERFNNAVADFLIREGEQISNYVNELHDRQIFARSDHTINKHR